MIRPVKVILLSTSTPRAINNVAYVAQLCKACPLYQRSMLKVHHVTVSMCSPEANAMAQTLTRWYKCSKQPSHWHGTSMCFAAHATQTMRKHELLPKEPSPTGSMARRCCSTFFTRCLKNDRFWRCALAPREQSLHKIIGLKECLEAFRSLLLLRPADLAVLPVAALGNPRKQSSNLQACAACLGAVPPLPICSSSSNTVWTPSDSV